MNKENNDLINKFLLVGDKFMPALHLWDPRVKQCSACGPFTKHEQRIKDFMKDGILSHIYKNELHKACFHHDIVLKNKADKIAVNRKLDGFQRA